MKSILIIASYAPSLVNFRGHLIERFLKEGYVVHTAAPGLTEDSATLEWLTSRSVQVHAIPLNRTGWNPNADLRALLALRRLMQSVNPAICLAYTIKPVIWGMLAARSSRVPKRVALITGLGYAFTDASSLKSIITRFIAKRLYRIALGQATLVFFQNKDDASDFRRWQVLPRNVPTQIVNGSGVDTRHFTKQPFPEGPPRFLLIARLLGNKGIREYVAAAAIVRNLGRMAEFHIVGGIDLNPDGIPQAEVEAWARSGVVKWHGAATDVRPYLAASHVYVLPSYREGTPRTVLEAMAMGRPIVTTDVPGCRETVRDGVNGHVVPKKDPQALAEAMLKFIDSPASIERMGEQSHQIVHEKFDVDAVNSQMITAVELG